MITGLANPSIIEETLATHALDPALIPRHVAIIMDGNGRWAKQSNKPRIKGHAKGRDTLHETVQNCSFLGIHYLSVYAFSTENWKRPVEEVSFLMELFRKSLRKFSKDLIRNGVRLKFFGRLNDLPNALQDDIAEYEKKTASNAVIQLNIMVNYGGRDEIVHACQAIVDKAIATQPQINPKTNPQTNPEGNSQTSSQTSSKLTVTEALISNHLYTKECPDPDLMIRTSNEHRLSNYMLWQLSYTELVFLDVLWPDFQMMHLAEAVRSYQNRTRRYGGLV